MKLDNSCVVLEVAIAVQTQSDIHIFNEVRYETIYQIRNCWEQVSAQIGGQLLVPIYQEITK